MLILPDRRDKLVQFDSVLHQGSTDFCLSEHWSYCPSILHTPHIMPLPLLESLSKPLETLAGPSRVPIDQLPASVNEIWQSAWSSHQNQDATKEGVEDKQVDIVKAVLEIVGRESTLSRIQDGSVSEMVGFYGSKADE